MKDTLFGSAAVKLGLAKAEQVEECLQIQQEMRKMGVDSPLGEIMVKKGYLTSVQQTQILQALGETVNAIPGYRFVSRIGQGGMGTVYKARHLKMDRVVAVKVIDPERAKDKDFVDRFNREAKAAAKLTHPNIVTAFDVGESSGTYFFVMEFVEGQPLSRMVLSQKIDPRRAATWMLQAAQALDYISRNGLIHRDVKPENLMITKEGALKLCDFGLAKSVVQSDIALTQTGWTMGTPLYMSPEQIRGEKLLDARTDIYSLGATFYHAVVGHPPFTGQNPSEVISKHLTQALTPIRDLNPAVPEGFAAIVQRCLKKDRAHRYPNAAELVADLKRFLSGAKPRASRDTLMTSVRAAAKKNKWVHPVWIGGAAALVLLLAVAGIPGGKTKPVPPRPASDPSPELSQEDIKAAELWASARGEFDRGRWPKALELFKRLTEEFRQTKTVAKHYEEIGKMTSECSTRIDAARTLYEEKVKKARTHFDLGEYKDAQTLLKTMREEHPDAPEVLQLWKSCSNELSFADAFAACRSTLDQGQWDKAQKSFEDVLRNFEGTRSLAHVRPSIEDDINACRAEINVTAEINLAKSMAVEKNWSGLLAKLKSLEGGFAKTRSFLARADDLRDLKRQAMQALEQQLRREAEELWSRALAALNKNEFEKAQELFGEYQEDYKDAEFYPSKRPDLEKNLELCEKKIKEVREREAEAKWKRALELAQKKDLSGALREASEFLAEFGETDHAKKQASAIQAKVLEWEKATAAAGPRTLIDDFESGSAQWNAVPSGHKQMTFSVAKEDRNGKNALRIAFPPMEKGDSRCFGAVSYATKGLPADTESISLWLKLGRGEKMTLAIDLYVSVPNSELAALRAKLPVTPQWEFRTVKLSEFVPVASQPAVDLSDLSKVTHIAIARADTLQSLPVNTNNDVNKEFVVFADEVTLNSGKKTAPTFAKGKATWDFEAGVAGWDTYRYPAVEWAKGADRKSKGALKATFPSRAASTHVATGWINVKMSGIDPDTTAFSFWIKLLRGNRATFSFDVTSQNQTFRHMFEATLEWKQVNIPVASLKPTWGTLPFDPKGVTRMSLSRYDAIGIGAPDQRTYTGNDANSEFVFLLDEIEVVTPNGRAMLFDFDAGTIPWEALAIAWKRSTAEAAKSDRGGKNVLKVVYPGNAQSSFGVIGQALSGLAPDVEKIRFWVKTPAAEKFALFLDLAEFDGGRPYNYRAKFDVTARWEQVTIEIAKLQRLNFPGDGTQMNRPKVLGVSFVRSDLAPTPQQRPMTNTGNEPAKDLTVLIDDVELVGKR